MTYYSRNHLWIKTEGENAEIGLTDYAIEKLGSIVFLNLPDVGDSLSVGERFGDIESIKTVSDLISPVDGEVLEINEMLLDEPEKVSEKPSEIWLVKACCACLPDSLMSAQEYDSLKEKL